MPKRIRPVSVAGIEFAAMMDETQTFNATIPDYPVESGFSVTDNIILQPMELPLTLLISDTPLTWRGRVRSVAETESMLKELYFSRETFSVVTPSGSFSDMAIVSMEIRRSTENGYNKEVALRLKKVNVTATKTATVPASYGKSGATGANAGTASTSKGSNGTAGGNSGSKKDSGSILYGAAMAAGLIKG